MSGAEQGDPIQQAADTKLKEAVDNGQDDTKATLADSARPSSVQEDRNIREGYTPQGNADFLSKVALEGKVAEEKWQPIPPKPPGLEDVIAGKIADDVHNALHEFPPNPKDVQNACDQANKAGDAAAVYDKLCKEHPEDKDKVHVEMHMGKDGKLTAVLEPGPDPFKSDHPMPGGKFETGIKSATAQDAKEKGDQKNPDGSVVHKDGEGRPVEITYPNPPGGSTDIDYGPPFTIQRHNADGSTTVCSEGNPNLQVTLIDANGKIVKSEETWPCSVNVGPDGEVDFQFHCHGTEVGCIWKTDGTIDGDIPEHGDDPGK